LVLVLPPLAQTLTWLSFTADLSGANEVDDPGDPDGTGSAAVVIDLDTSEVCFTITFDGIDPVAAHIHEGGAGPS
jgi:hypothetical protein